MTGDIARLVSCWQAGSVAEQSRIKTRSFGSGCDEWWTAYDDADDGTVGSVAP